MNYGEGSSFTVDRGSTSSSSSSSSDSDDFESVLEMQKRNLMLQTTILMNQEEEMMQQYYLSQSLNRTVWGGSSYDHATINRGRQAGATLLKNDYFVENSTFETQFRRRFRMQRSLFQRIRKGLKEWSPLWKTRYSARGVKGFSSYEKMCASLQFLAYGTSADSFDQYFRIAESTLLDYVKHFCQDINAVFGKEYLRKPNASDIDHLLQVAEARGFPGMLGSLDCMHWKWKNCPTRDAGAYRGRNKACTIILEAVASYDTWIWHAFFGLPGTNNDINVLNKSHLFRNLENGISLPANYSIKGRNYNVGYYLTDSIYPKWSTLVQAISNPADQKEMHFVKQQEGYRKDVERAFGVLQARFAIVRGGARLWNKSTVQDVMNACIIMHNMIVEDERSGYLNTYVFHEMPPALNTDYESSPTMPDVTVQRNLSNERYMKWLRVHRDIMNAGEHDELQARLVHHLWDIRGDMDD